MIACFDCNVASFCVGSKFAAATLSVDCEVIVKWPDLFGMVFSANLSTASSSSLRFTGEY
jgi:hypothetical protein